MFKLKTTLAVLCMTLGLGAFAQEVEINPTPHNLEIIKPGSLSVTDGFRIKDVHGCFGDILSRFGESAKKGLPLTVDFGGKAAVKYNVPQVEGAYVLESGDKGVTIVGYDEQGAFYGLQSLLQAIDKDGNLPYLKITDYPDMPYRGVVEGFYGNPWTHATRVSLLDFYGKFKMNTYLYGPKDDPYHSSPNWRLPYPEKEAEQIKELVEAAKRNRVDFVWAIHPGKDIEWTEEDYQKLLAKFESMYALGVRSFALFFDDISGQGTNPVRQAELLNRLHDEFVTVKGDVSPLIMCPTDYTRLWANPDDDGYLAILGKTLDPSIQIMWTGDAVCGDITKETLAWVSHRIRRPALIWWNYPVTDYVRNLVLQGPVYGLDSTATRSTMAGFVSNPMEHGEASKLALYGVADYTWNISDYKPLYNWEKALAELMPRAKEAYRTFAIHSCDTETGYRRDESWETVTFPIDNYTDAQYDALMAEFEKIEAAPEAIEEGCDNKALLEELKPWLVEFEKLGKRGRTTLEMIKLLENGDNAEFWERYARNTMSAAETEAYNAHKLGTLKLQPFIETSTDAMANKYYAELSGEPLPVQKAIGTFKSLPTTQSKLMLDDDILTYYTSGQAQRSGDWIGVDLGEITDVKEVVIRQGRNTPNDVDFFDHARLEYSVDGNEWATLRDSIVNEYDITFECAPVKARYVRLLRLDSDRKNWVAVREFSVNPLKRSAVFFTDIERLASQSVNMVDGKVTVAPLLEIVNVQPEGYFGVELPYITSINKIDASLGNKGWKPEYSVDGKQWDGNATSARFVRFRNNSGKVMSLKMDKLIIETDASNDESAVYIFDKDLNTAYTPDGDFKVAVPESTVTATLLLKGSTPNVLARELNANGDLVKEHRIDGNFCQFAVSEGVTDIEIVGMPTVCEVIFKK